MTEDEKKLLQEKHRLEEAIARDRVKERKARTHRLIVEGAALEKVLPEIKTAETDNPEEFLHRLNRFRINAKTQTLRLSSSFPKSLSDFS